MIFRIADDVVERRLELIGRRTFGEAFWQLIFTVGTVGIVVVYFATICGNLVAKMPADWLGRFDCWWRLIAALALLGLPALVIGGLFVRAVSTQGGWQRLIWDGRASDFVAVGRQGMLGYRQSTTIPLAEIRRIDLHASPEGQNLTLKLVFHSGKQLQRAPLEATVHVQHVDRRDEAMDLLFRIGRMCGLGHYAIEENDLRNLKLRLVRDTKNSERFQPIPEGSSAVRYEDNVVSQGVQTPPLAVGKFRRKAYEQSVSGTHLIEWQPGQMVHFHEPAAGVEIYAIASGVVALITGFISYEAAPLAAAWLPGWATMIVAMLIAALVACLGVFISRPSRDVIFDWPAGRVSWRTGWRTRQTPLRVIDSLLLRGCEKYVKQKGRPGYTNYWCRLEMIVGGRTIFILQSDKFRDLADAPAERLGPLAAALAESLNVPWQWRDYGA